MNRLEETTPKIKSSSYDSGSSSSDSSSGSFMPSSPAFQTTPTDVSGKGSSMNIFAVFDFKTLLILVLLFVLLFSYLGINILTILGDSMERFVAVLLEHCAGDFPLWLTSDQFIILPISEKFNDYAEKVSEFLNNSDIRGLVDDRNEKIGKKIRDAELAKIPFMLIVGENEFAKNQVSVRQRGGGDMGVVSFEEFGKIVQEAINKELTVEL